MTRNLEFAFAGESDLPHHDDWLSSRERAILDGLQVAKRRSDWRLGRWSAKQAAEKVHGGKAVEVIAAPDGAPELYVDGRRTRDVVSISHSHGVAMSVLSRRGDRVGCDIERVEPRSLEFIRSYFTLSEIGFVRVLSEDERPAICNAIWSAKESVLKAMRIGLRVDTRLVEIALVYGSGWQRFTGTINGCTWRGIWRRDGEWVHTVATGLL